MQQLPTETTNSSTFHAIGRWTILKEIGSGSTSKVFLGVDPSNQQRAAIKVFTVNSKISHFLLKVESSILKKLSHNNIVHFVEAHKSIDFFNHNTGQTSSVSALVMEYVAGGEFFEMLEHRGCLSENVSRFLFRQIIDALNHMHVNNIAHRDIKLENILIDEGNNIKIADFGYSSFMNSSKTLGNVAGTTNYFTPEIHARSSASGESADIFAAGIILFSMVSGHMPFAAATPNDEVYGLFFKNDQKTFWSFHSDISKTKNSKFKFSEEFKDLMNKIFDTNPNKRAKIKDILNHPWMKASEKNKEVK